VWLLRRRSLSPCSCAVRVDPDTQRLVVRSQVGRLPRVRPGARVGDQQAPRQAVRLGDLIGEVEPHDELATLFFPRQTESE
jgi:hypothetical protein